MIVPPQRDVSWLDARDVPLRGWRARYGEVASITSGGGSVGLRDPDPRPADAGAADLRIARGVADASTERAGARFGHDLHEDGEIGVPDLELLLTRQTHDCSLRFVCLSKGHAMTTLRTQMAASHGCERSYAVEYINTIVPIATRWPQITSHLLR